MKKLITYSLLMMLGISFGQSSINSLGANQTSNSYQLTPSLGEVVNASYVSPKYILKQGVLQVVLDVVTDLSEELVLETNAYPSPFSEYIQVKLNIEGTFLASLVTMDGKTVSSDEYASNEFTINTSSLPIGGYVLEIVNEAKGLKRTVKLIKAE